MSSKKKSKPSKTSSRKAPHARKPAKKPAAKPAARAAKKPAAKANKPARKAKAAAADWRDLTAGDVMQTDLVTIAANAPLSDVERLLSENRISGVPVTNEAGKVIGVLSVRDLVERYTQDPDSRPRRGRSFYEVATYDLDDEDLESFEVPAESEETVGDLMTTQVIAVEREDSLRTVAMAMVASNVHRVLVHDGPRTVGLVTTMDLLRVAAR